MFVRALVLAMLLLAFTSAANVSFTSNFIMYVNEEAYNGRDGPTPAGYYLGKMDYRYDESNEYSYRVMNYYNDVGYSNLLFTETFVHAAMPNDTEHTVITVKMTSCSGNCLYKELPYNKAELLFSGSDITDSYISSIEFSDNHVTKFVTANGNIFFLNNYVPANSFVVPTYFGECLRKTCSVSIDFTVSIDISYSMRNNLAVCNSDDCSTNDIRKSRFAAAKSLIKQLGESALFNVAEGGSFASIIGWYRHAVPIFVSRKTINEYYTKGFINNHNEFLADVEALPTDERFTCLGCGYKAGVELTYIQFLYESNKFNQNQDDPIGKRVKNTGHLLIIMTDGESNARIDNNTTFLYRNDANQLKNYKSNIWYGTYSENYKDVDKQKEFLANLRDNFKTFYGESHAISTNLGGLNDRVDFFDKLTIITLGIYEATKLTSLFNVYSQPGSASSSFKTSYTIAQLTGETMQQFYNALSTSICSAFQGDQDNCSEEHIPCCNNNLYCPLCPSRLPCYNDQCNKNSNFKCFYSTACKPNNNGDCGVFNSCEVDPNNSTNPICHYKTRKPTTAELSQMDICYDYRCRSSSYLNQVSTSCRDRLYDPQSPEYDQHNCPDKCEKGRHFYSELKHITDAEWSFDNIDWDNQEGIPWNQLQITDGEKFSDFCYISDNCDETPLCYDSEVVDKNTPKCPEWANLCTNQSNPTEDECYKQGSSNCFKLTKVKKHTTSCKIIDCEIITENGVSKEKRTEEDIQCGNLCHTCIGQETCAVDPKNDDPCLDPTINPNYKTTMYEGCFELPSCDPSLNNKTGGCTEIIDYCGRNSTYCEQYYCKTEEIVDGNGNTKVVGHCEVDEDASPHCTLPSYLSSECYNSVCLNERFGCFIIIDFDKLNDCGDCGEFLSCDESSLVVSAAIGAGIVAAIIIIAVIALAIGVIASKKMYDLISGANEVQMEAAHFNSLYQEADVGGVNPLFEEN